MGPTGSDPGLGPGPFPTQHMRISSSVTQDGDCVLVSFYLIVVRQLIMYFLKVNNVNVLTIFFCIVIEGFE